MGYLLDMKVEKKWNPSIFLATYHGTYHKHLAIRKKKKKKNLQKIFKNLANLSHFFHEKSFVISRNHIFQVKIWQKFTSKRNTEWSWGFNTRTTSLVCIIIFSIKSKYPIPGSGWYDNLKMYPISSRPGWYESFKMYPISSSSGWYEKYLKILLKYWNQIDIL